MRDLFIRILSSYQKARTQRFKNHELANYLRNSPVEVIKKAALIDMERYTIEGSPGKGNWAEIPWIAVFDKEISETATKGYYIVYLFCADMSGFYISLNQGWTYFKEKYGIKEGRNKILQVSKAWQDILSSTLKDFSFDPIDLKHHTNNSDLPKGYELGHICGKFYSIPDIPSEETLALDLQNLLGVFRELKGKLVELSIEKTNDLLIVNNQLSIINTEQSADEINGLETCIENYEKSKLDHVEMPPAFSNHPQKQAQPKAFKIDHIKKMVKQTKLGLAGELLVLKYEIDYLVKNNKRELADKVKHIAKINDNAGYDILSFELDGQEKHIEVKTTTGGSETSFFITDNELEHSKEEFSKYYLYRVYNFDKTQNHAEFYSIKGNLSDKLNLKPKVFIVDGLTETNLDSV
jgi:hypothetical protein